MAPKDPLITHFNWRHGYWNGTQGRETFYAESPDRLTGGNEKNELITCKTEPAAIKWIAESPGRNTGGNEHENSYRNAGQVSKPAEGLSK